MDLKKALISLGVAAASSRLAQRITHIEADDVFGLFGLERRRSQALPAIGLVAVGAVVGAGVALLLAPDSGMETRKRLGRQVERLGQAAGEAAREAKAEIPARISRMTNELRSEANQNTHHG